MESNTTDSGKLLEMEVHLTQALLMLDEGGEYHFSKAGILLTKTGNKYRCDSVTLTALQGLVSQEWIEQYIQTT